MLYVLFISVIFYIYLAHNQIEEIFVLMCLYNSLLSLCLYNSLLLLCSYIIFVISVFTLISLPLHFVWNITWNIINLIQKPLITKQTLININYHH